MFVTFVRTFFLFVFQIIEIEISLRMYCTIILITDFDVIYIYLIPCCETDNRVGITELEKG